MRNVLSKVRWKVKNFNVHIRILWFEITKPFRVAYNMTKHKRELKKIDEEYENGWDRYMKKKELENKDNLEAKQMDFALLKAEILITHFKMITSELVFVISKEYPEKTIEEGCIEFSKEEFLKNKKDLCCLINEIKTHYEISFDSEIEMKIKNWTYEEFETREELTSWKDSFSNYLSTLNVI